MTPLNQEPTTDILLIEHNELDAHLVEITLRESKLITENLWRAKTIAEAIQLLKIHSFDVIISDLNLPDASGLEINDFLDPYLENTPLIILTNEDDDEMLSKNLLSRGTQDYLSKRHINCHFLSKTIYHSIERFKLAHRLKNSESKFRALSENAPVGIFMTDLKGKCIYSNQKFKDIAHTSMEGEIWYKAVFQSDQNHIKSLWNHFVEAKDLFQGECRFGQKDQDMAWTVCKIVPLREGPREVTGYIGNVMDVTVLKEAYLELEQRRENLEKSNLELDTFVYTASHDLRAPLRGVSCFADFLVEDLGDRIDEKGREYIDEIHKGVNRMNKLIEDLLSLSRLSRVNNPFGKVSVKSMLDDVLERIELDIKQTQTDIKIHADLPEVLCDRIKITEVFVNLISNAIKFSSKNNVVKPMIEVGFRVLDECTEFWVQDNGIGIDSKYFDKIFVLFERLHDQDEYDGTGAGLSIVRRIVNDHGGFIRVDSEKGKGARFTFTIPHKPYRRKKLGEILIEKGLITEAQLKDSLSSQDTTEK